MISHTTLGTNDMEQSERFYSRILTEIGGVQIYKSDTAVFWEFSEGHAKFCLTVPFDGEPATHGNGSMVAFTLTSNHQVDEVFKIAIASGATSEGEPGERNDGAYYA